MRRKPSSQGNGGYNNQQRKQRYQGPGSSNMHGHGGHHSHSGGRPRRNYAAAREKYLAQARDALAAGDRVLAENYYQHADHCYRMMVEEGFQPRSMQQQQQQNPDQPQGNDAQPQVTEEPIIENNSQLPSFITGGFQPAQQATTVDPAAIQNWEERDSDA